MTFRSLISGDEANSNSSLEKIHTKLLALGVLDFTKAYQIIEHHKKISTDIENNQEEIPIDLVVYEYLSHNKISQKDFHVKHILSLTFSIHNKVNPNSAELLLRLDKLFPKKNKVSSMTPNPIHFGPLEGFLSDSFSNIDLKTLIITIGFWMTVYLLIIYYLYL